MSPNEMKFTIYTIKIKGLLKEAWAEWLNGLVMCIKRSNDQSNDTSIIIRVPDQAALRGIMNKLWDLNLTVISIYSQDMKMIGDNDEN